MADPVGSDHEPSTPEVEGRSFTSALSGAILAGIQTGTLKGVYRGVPCLKSPFDLALYLQLLSRLRPRTVIEIGTKYGGSALWFADLLTADRGPGIRVISVDIVMEAGFQDDRITFLEGDAARLEPTLKPELLAELPRPWLVIEDSSHQFADAVAVLGFFHPFLASGDYIVVEDGILDQFDDPVYLRYANGPNRAVSSFLEQHPGSYAVDAELCDHFGRNVTWNPNGWLRRL
jgi:cephalosporin hydroxylase